jgi:hypothetical protein
MLTTSESTDSLMAEAAKTRWYLKKVKEENPKDVKWNRSKFGWRNAMDGYHFTFVWEQQVEGVGQNSRGGYKSIMHGQAGRTVSLPMYHTIKSKFASAPDEGPLLIHMHTMASGFEFGTTIVATMATAAAAITANTKNMLYLVVDEAPPGTKDEEKAIRQIYVAPAILSVMRTIRLETPQMNPAFLAMDSASWHTYRSDVIAALPDVLQSEEGEIHFMKGTAYAGTLICNDIGPAVDKNTDPPAVKGKK